MFSTWVFLASLSCSALLTNAFTLRMLSSVSFQHLAPLQRLSGEKRQVVVYLPGLDGVGNYSSLALGALIDSYELYRMQIAADDRSSFLQLVQAVIKQIQSIDRTVILIGESFGGVLAAYVAAKYPKLVSRVVLVNPATSIRETNWQALAPLLASTGPLYPVLGISSLLATSMDMQQVVDIGRKVAGRVSDPQTLPMALMDELKPLLQLPDALPPQTLTWRLQQWLGTGNFLVKDCLDDVQCPCLLLIGSDDRLLPSRREGPKLRSQLFKSPFVSLRVFAGRGHALLDRSFDLLHELESFERQYQRRTARDYALITPTPREIQEVDERLGPFFEAASPVYFSINKQGNIAEDLRHVPVGTEGRPVLLVGNHQLLGLDLGLIVREFLREKNTLVRGLAHPLLFSQSMRDSELTELFVKFGAVPVSPMSFFQLLRNNETVLLFPGGAREALHRKNESYTLLWPERTDFVRMAGLMDAIIVPFAAVGIVDSTPILLDAEDWKKIPFVRPFTPPPEVKSGNERLTEQLMPPVVAPAPPARNYFLFLPPIDTRDYDMHNKHVCRGLYLSIQTRLQSSLRQLQRYRDQDGNRNFFPRFLVERGSGKKADYPPVTLLKKSLQEAGVLNEYSQALDVQG